MTATATKTSVKKCVRAGSNFIAFMPSRSIRQMSANLSGVGILKDRIKVQEKRKRVVVLCSRPLKTRDIRHFHAFH